MEGFERSRAFLVAIDGYSNGVPPLRTPVADAKALARCLSDDHGFDTELILDADATLAGIRMFLSDLSKRVGSNDRVLFYFAGHGVAIEGDTGPTGYVLPQDADRGSDSKFLAMLELHAALSALPCRHMLVILDCCFAGAFQWASTRHLALAPEHLHQERYMWFISDPAWQAIASAAYDQKALDVAAEKPLGKRNDSQEHSPFAAALLNGLRGSADLATAGQAGDGVITATELYQFLVEALLPRAEGEFRQTPIFWPLKKHDKGQFVFLVPGRELALPAAPLLDAEANPWRGLEVYEEQHKEVFYGRGGAADRLAERILGRNAGGDTPAISAERFIVLTGPSGIGKSSLVLAGLLPRLKDKDALGERLCSVIVRPAKPGPTPFASLAAALRRAMPIDVETPDEPSLASQSDALANWLDEQDESKEFLLIVDQAEELITIGTDPSAQTQFTELIAQALNRTKRNLRVVFNVRSEFESQFVQSPLAPRWAAARFLVPQMTQDELRRVIEGPAAVKVMRFESAELVDTLVNEVVNMPGALPLLSFALSQMYRNYLDRHTTDRVLTHDDYDRLGGGVTASLRVRANQIVDEGDAVYRSAARRVLERFVSLEAGEFARRRVPRREFEVDAKDQSRIDHILGRLDQERLIVTDDANGASYLELAHDALILGWDRLLAWVRQDAPLITALRRLTSDAEDWESSDRGKRGLLWSDPARLQLTKSLMREPSPGLNRAESRFATASVRRARRNTAIRGTIAGALLSLSIGATWLAYSSEIRKAEAMLLLAASQIREASSGDAIVTIEAALSLATEFDAAIVQEAQGLLLELTHGSHSVLISSDDSTYQDRRILTPDPARHLLSFRAGGSFSELINFDGTRFDQSADEQSCSMNNVGGEIACRSVEHVLVTSGRTGSTFRLPPDVSGFFAISKDGSQLGVLSNNSLQIYSKDQSAPSLTLPVESTEQVNALFFDQNRQPNWVTEFGDVYAANLDSGTISRRYKYDGPYLDPDIYVDRQRTAALLRAGNEYVLLALTGLADPFLFDGEGASRAMPKAALSPRGDRAAGIRDGKLVLIDVNEQKELARLDVTGNFGVQFTPDGSEVAVVSEAESRAYVFDASSGRPLSSFGLTLQSDLETTSSESTIVAMDVCPQKGCLAVLDNVGRLQIFGLNSGIRFLRMEVPVRAIPELVVSENAEYLALSGVLDPSTVFNQGQLAVNFYRISMPGSLIPLANYQQWGLCSSVSPRGEAVAVSDCAENSAYELFSSEGRRIGTLRAGNGVPSTSTFGGTHPISFSMSSKVVATVEDRQVMLWSVIDARLLRSISAPFPDRKVVDVRFMDQDRILLLLDELGNLSAIDTANGSRFMLENSDPIDRLIPVATGEVAIIRKVGQRDLFLLKRDDQRLALFRLEGSIELDTDIVALDPAGVTVVSVMMDGTVRAWSIQTGREISTRARLPDRLDRSEAQIDVAPGGRRILAWQKGKAPALIDIGGPSSPIDLRLPKLRDYDDLEMAGFNSDGNVVGLFGFGTLAFWLDPNATPKIIQPISLGLVSGEFDSLRTMLLVRGNVGHSGDPCAFLVPIVTNLTELVEAARQVPAR
ncbi:caspase family protein [Mesorhizobium sp. WSM2561]|uniref:nSTAND1 domain-containing NTPase n=1 Tax=Mesorhizobium sp. WSM2561 TaxID=1040985 RepID=UPI0004B10D6A|nr:caspase family protein [Mesorhizobium sp. WSM2561]